MKWDAKLYEMFGKERLQPSIDLLNRIPDGEYEKIIDIGCGSGMSTVPLRKRFKEADIYGVDLSEEMLSKAREVSKDIKWIQRDCSKSLIDLGKFDIVFSNAFIQWLQNQEEFIKNVCEMIKDDGILALQVPNYDNMLIKKCVDITKKKYGSVFDNIDKKMCHNNTLGEYYDMLSEYFSDVTIWQTNYQHVMDSYEAIVDFMSATGIKPYLEILLENDQKEFKEKLISELKKAYPIQKNGKILFVFERIEFIARK